MSSKKCFLWHSQILFIDTKNHENLQICKSFVKNDTLCRNLSLSPSLSLSLSLSYDRLRSLSLTLPFFLSFSFSFSYSFSHISGFQISQSLFFCLILSYQWDEVSLSVCRSLSFFLSFFFYRIWNLFLSVSFFLSLFFLFLFLSDQRVWSLPISVFL